MHFLSSWMDGFTDGFGRTGVVEMSTGRKICRKFWPDPFICTGFNRFVCTISNRNELEYVCSKDTVRVYA